MRILAIDTSTKNLCLALKDGEKVYEYSLEVGKQMSSLLTLTIKRVLDAVGLKISDIDYFACGVGPGSFTGVRMGLASVKALAYPLKRPVVEVCSLDTLALNVKQDNCYIFSAIDAKRNLIYSAVYKKTNDKIKKVSGYKLLTLEDFIKEAKKIVSTSKKFSSIILGDALAVFKDKIANEFGSQVILLDKDYWTLKPSSLILLAQDSVINKKTKSLFKVNPIYLYPKECQIRQSVNKDAKK